MTRTSVLLTLTLGLGLSIAMPLAAQDAQSADVAAEAVPETIVAHGIKTFGTLKYGPDAEHLDYVNPDAPQGGELSMEWLGGFDSMNPYARKGRAGLLASTIFEDMMVPTADEIGALYCLLCETVEYPEDRAWALFTLRPEAAFSDGTPITAQDVAFSVELLAEQGLPSFRKVFADVVESVDVIDDHHIRYTFKPDYPVRDRVQTVGSLPVMSKTWFETTGARLDESRLEAGIGSAPYVVGEVEANERLIYKRNRDYWGNDLWLNRGRNNFDAIRVEYYADSNAAFEGFKAGQYLFRREATSKTWATGYDFPAVEQGTIVRQELEDGTITTGQGYVLNLHREQFQDPRVREAIGLMFNFEWTNATLFYGLYQRIEGFWHNSPLAPTGEPSPRERALLEPLVAEGLLDEALLSDGPVVPPTSGASQLDRTNLRRASALLDEAGWEVGDDGLRRKDGQVLSLEILEDAPTFDRVHNPFVSNLKRLGVDAKITRVDNAQATDRARDHDFDMVVDHFPMGYEPGASLSQYFGSENADSVFNAAGLADPAVDQLIKIVRAAETQEELYAAVGALDRVLRAKRFWIPHWYSGRHLVAYYDLYRHPEPLPPYDLGFLDLWWVDPEAEAALKAADKL